MALDPNEIVSEGWLEDNPNDWPANIKLPDGVTKSTEFYGYQRTYKNGRRVIEWFKRGSGPDKQDPVLTKTEDEVPAIKEKWDKADAEEKEKSGKPPEERNNNGRRERWNPTTRTWDDVGVAVNATAPPAASTAPAERPVEKDEGGTRYVWQANPGGPAAGGQWVAVGSAPETPAERQAREANAPTQSIAVRKGGDGRDYTVITIVPKPGQPGSPGTIVLGPDGKPAPAGIPGEPPKTDRKFITGPDGKTYIQVSVQHPDGRAELYTTDQQGVRTTLPNAAPDNPTVAGPKLPQFVLGQSQEALATYKTQLQEGVAAGLWSQKWANDRWSEAVQVANSAVQEAATQQREVESTRAAEINLAQSRATLGQNMIQQAASVVDRINGLLPEGSSLGGQAFAAMMGIGMLMQSRSGIDSIDPKGRPPTITKADLNNPDALGAKRAQIMANPAFKPAAPAPAPAPAPVAAPVAAGPRPAVSEPTPGQNPAAARVTAPVAAPAPVAAAPAPLPGAAASVVQPVAPDGNEQDDDILTVSSQQGGSREMTRADFNALPLEVRGSLVVTNARPNPARQQQPTAPVEQPGAPMSNNGPTDPGDGFVFEPGSRPAPAPAPAPEGIPGNPDYQPGLPPGTSILPQPANQMPVDVPYPQSDGAQSRGAPAGYPVLAAYQPVMMKASTGPAMEPGGGDAPMMPSRTQGTGFEPWPSYTQGTGLDPMTITPSGSPRSMPGTVYDGGPMMPSRTQGTGLDPNARQQTPYPAVLQARARSLAPWQIPTDELQQMMDAGISEDDIWSLPGQQRRIA